MYCKQCGNQLDEGSAFCPNCGAPTVDRAEQPAPAAPANQKSKMAAGLLGVFLGCWGVHNFYLGYTGKAVAQLILYFVTCGISSLWGFIEGILILVGNINTDANGVSLGE